MPGHGARSTRICFAIMPFRDDLARVYQKAILPAAEEAGLHCVRGDQAPGPVITEAVERGIAQAAVCIADLTGLNHNVIFEVALALSRRKRLVLITQDSTDSLPFDLRHLRVHTYKPSPAGLQRLCSLLRDSFLAELKGQDSPIRLLQAMILPDSLEPGRPHIVAASPLSWRQARQKGGGHKRLRPTFSDHVGIRGLIHAFGVISVLQDLPDLLDPGDFETEVGLTPANLYCLGSSKSNRWTGPALKKFSEKRTPRFAFRPDPESEDLRDVHVDLHRDGQKWLPGGWSGSTHRYEKDFGLIVRGPHPNDPGALLMVLAGRGAVGTEAACRAVTEGETLSALQEWLQLRDIDLNDHRQAFWAIVAMARDRGTGETLPGTLKICQVDGFQEA